MRSGQVAVTITQEPLEKGQVLYAVFAHLVCKVPICSRKEKAGESCCVQM